MENRRLHYFPENHCSVVTALLPTGGYLAFRSDCEDNFRGFGHTRLAAIADLVEVIGHVEEDEEANDEAAFDHAQDYRKNWEPV